MAVSKQHSVMPKRAKKYSWVKQLARGMVGQEERRSASILGTMVVVYRTSTREKWRRKKYTGECRAESASVRKMIRELPSKVIK